MVFCFNCSFLTIVQSAAAYNYSVYPYLDTLRLVNDKQSPIPGVQFFLTPGHSPGHMSIEISSEGETLRVTGDTWISRVSNHLTVYIERLWSKPGRDSFEHTDIAFIPSSFQQADQLQNPEWGFLVESSRETAFNSRVDLLDSLAKNRALTLAYHEQFPGLGYVSTWGPFYDWMPAPLSMAAL